MLLIAPLMAWTALAAQGVPPPPDVTRETATPKERPNQKIERIHIEDDGATIDETRYGGQTQTITVQPKADVPEYEIQTPDMARTRPADHRDGMGSATGTRVWNVFKF